MTDHTALLRRAAAKARATAQAATPGPWWAHQQEDEATVLPRHAEAVARALLNPKDT